MVQYRDTKSALPCIPRGTQATRFWCLALYVTTVLLSRVSISYQGMHIMHGKVWRARSAGVGAQPHGRRSGCDAYFTPVSASHG